MFYSSFMNGRLDKTSTSNNPANISFIDKPLAICPKCKKANLKMSINLSLPSSLMNSSSLTPRHQQICPCSIQNNSINLNYTLDDTIADDQDVIECDEEEEKSTLVAGPSPLSKASRKSDSKKRPEKVVDWLVSNESKTSTNKKEYTNNGSCLETKNDDRSNRSINSAEYSEDYEDFTPSWQLNSNSNHSTTFKIDPESRIKKIRNNAAESTDDSLVLKNRAIRKNNIPLSTTTKSILKRYSKSKQTYINRNNLNSFFDKDNSKLSETNDSLITEDNSMTIDDNIIYGNEKVYENLEITILPNSCKFVNFDNFHEDTDSSFKKIYARIY
jgi:hypothetical protein